MSLVDAFVRLKDSPRLPDAALHRAAASRYEYADRRHRVGEGATAKGAAELGVGKDSGQRPSSAARSVAWSASSPDTGSRAALRRRWGAALPPGSAGIVAIYDRAKTDTVNTTLASAVRKPVAQVDGGGAKELKAALAEAQAGIGG